jgi:hypothetical protein
MAIPCNRIILQKQLQNDHTHLVFTYHHPSSAFVYSFLTSGTWHTLVGSYNIGLRVVGLEVVVGLRVVGLEFVVGLSVTGMDVGLRAVGLVVVGILVVGSLVVGSYVVGSLVVGSYVVGSLVGF